MIHKTTRSILSVLLAALLLVTSTPLTPAFADGGTVSPQSESGEGRALTGSGTANDPYKISTAAELREFAQRVNGTDGNSADPGAHAKLMNDINLSEICGEDVDGQSVSWTPIGNSRPYRGTFNGAGHTISGLYINDSTADDQGLFGYVSGTVQNLTVSGSVKGDDYVGGVVGQNNGTVTNCAFSGSVSGVGPVGGVVGYNISSVTNCYNTGEVSGGAGVGGVVGDNISSVENCYNTGTVIGSGGLAGGVVGQNSSGDSSGDSSGSVTNSYNTGAVSGGEKVGGVVGQNCASVTNCYNTGNVSGNRSVGGVVGNNGGTVENCYFLQTTGVNESLQGIGNDGSAAGAAAVNNLSDLCEAFNDTNTWTISDTLKRPVLKDNHEDDGTQAHPYRISTAAQLENFRDLVNGKDGQAANPNAHAKLMNDIDLSSVCSAEEGSWTPIGNSIDNLYEGTFNGDGHTISGLYIAGDDDDQGLFGFVGSEGTVQNLTVSGSASVSHGENVGGIVGYNFSGTVTNCAFSGSVGGIFSGSYVGGIVGYNSSGTVTNCAFSGSVSGSVSGDYVGGVVGYNNGGTVTGCTFSGSGSVSGGSYVGGVVGWNSSDVNVTNCYNIGSVSGSASYVGGVVGQNLGTVENCYNTGAVSGSGLYVGGVVGDNSGTVENCYNTGTVTGNYVGGVVGQNINGSVTNCYYQNDKASAGIGGSDSETDEAIAKDNTAFHSGEVAYLLQSKQTDGSSQVWGQTLGGEEDSLPTLVALNPDAAKEVYQLTFDWRYEGAPEGTTTTTNVYTNGSVTIPEINHDRTGYHISGWKDKNEKPVTAETTVEEDAVFTAEWTANTYTITVTAGSGGTVSGGGNVTHGDSVEVTATANQGYHFVNWTENGTEVSTSATYSFTATANRTLTANFAADAVEPDPDPTPTPTPTPDPEPSGPSTDGSSGWDDIRDELENAAKGDQITIDMGDETKVPAEIFESLAGKDVDVTFDLGDIQWSVNGADIPTDTDFTDLDLGASLGTSGIPVNVINTITGEVGTVQITLAHDGEFGFTMTLTAPLGKENAGYWANLYHYDEDAEALNFEAAAKIDETGSVTIPFSHASQYAIVIDTHSHATVDVSDLFLDIAPDAWYKDAVQYAYDNGLMTGVSATEFAPEQTTTRAMIVSILARLEDVTTAEAAGFADVDDNDWYATAVNWAANVGVVNGYEDNTFKPNTAITREQLAAILMNYAAYKGEDVSNRASLATYTDQPSTWAEEAMSWAVAEGLISGVTNDELQPQGNATRAQVAAILQRLLEA